MEQGHFQDGRPLSHSEMDLEDLERASGPQQRQGPQDGTRSHQGAAGANRASRSMAAARLGLLMALVERRGQLAGVLRHGYADPATVAHIGVGPENYRIIRGVLQRVQRAYANAGGNVATLERVIRRGPEIAAQRQAQLIAPLTLEDWLGGRVLKEETEAILGFDPATLSPQEAMAAAKPLTSVVRTELGAVMEELARRPAAFAMLDNVAANTVRQSQEPPKTSQEAAPLAKESASTTDGQPSAKGLSGAPEGKQTFLQKAWAWIKKNPLVTFLIAVVAGGWLWKRFGRKKEENGWPESGGEPVNPKRA